MFKDNKDKNQRNAERVPVQSNRFSLFTPFEEMWEPYRLFDDFMTRNFPWNLRNESFYSPALEVEETDSEYILSTDLPGVPKDNISIDCSGNQLRIHAERSEESTNKRRGSSHRFYGTYEKHLTLPSGVKAEEIKAAYDNGVLTVHIPKGEESRPRRIEINDAKKTSSLEDKVSVSSSKDQSTQARH